MSFLRRLRCVLLTAALASVGAAASAQTPAATPQDQPPTDPAAERARLLRQAQQSRSRGDHIQALYYARAAGELRMTISVRLFIAEESVELGRLLDAAEAADDCVREAASEPPSPNHAVVLEGCRHMLADVDPRLARVTVDRPPQAAADMALRFTLAGRRLPSEQLGQPVRVLPGRVVVELEANGFRPARAEITVAAGGASHVSLPLEREPAEGGGSVASPGGASDGSTAGATLIEVVPPLAGASVRFDDNPALRSSGGEVVRAELPPGPHVVRVSAPGYRSITRAVLLRAGETLHVEIPPLEPSGRGANGVLAPRSVVSPVGAVVTAVGGVLILGGVVAWFVSEGSYHQLQMDCPDGPCPDEHNQGLAASVRTWDAVANVGIFGGAATVATGAVLLLVLRQTENGPERPRVRTWLTPEGAGLTLTGRF